jgi:hypothetical protein
MVDEVGFGYATMLSVTANCNFECGTVVCQDTDEPRTGLCGIDRIDYDFAYRNRSIAAIRLPELTL